MRKLVQRVILLFLGNSIIVVFIVLCAALGILSNKFFTIRNWFNIFNNFAVVGIVSFEVSVVLIGGGIDLSFGPILASCAVLATLFQPRSFWLAVLLPPILGAAMGSVSGLIVSKIRTNPLITTLGTQWLFYSTLMIITEGHLVQGNQETFFKEIGYGKLFGIPFPAYLLVIMCLIVFFILRKTRFGKYVYAHGSRRQALFNAGINTSNVYLLTFVFMGIMIGVGGVLLSSRLIGVRPTEGGRYLAEWFSLGRVKLQPPS